MRNTLKSERKRGQSGAKANEGRARAMRAGRKRTRANEGRARANRPLLEPVGIFAVAAGFLSFTLGNG